MPSPDGHSPYSTVGYSGDSAADALVSGYKWGGGAGTGVALTYSFPDDDSSWSNVSYSSHSQPYRGFAPLSSSEQADFASALDAWADVSRVSFSRVNEGSNSV